MSDHSDNESDDESIEEIESEQGDYEEELLDEADQEDDDLGNFEEIEEEEKGSESEEESDEESENDETSSKVDHPVKIVGKKPLPDMFHKVTQTEFIKIIQTLSHLLDESTLVLTEDEIRRNLGNTGLSPEMAFRLFRDQKVSLPLSITRFNQAYQSIELDIRKYPINMDLYTTDLDSEELHYTEKYFTKNFK